MVAVKTMLQLLLTATVNVTVLFCLLYLFWTVNFSCCIAVVWLLGVFFVSFGFFWIFSYLIIALVDLAI